jgi:ABC-type amino acid transport substrate-binding protein
VILIVIITVAAIFLIRPDRRPPTGIKNTPSSYDSYEYGQNPEKVVDFGTQPNAIFTSESLFHDRILQQQLADKGWTLREHRFRNGKDMVPYTDGRLDVMVLGDLPAYVAMSTHKVGIFAVCRQGYNTLVASRRITPPELKGLRVGYPAITTAHFALDRALASANLTLDDIISVPMAPDEMEAAMRSHTVDAIVSWEPTASSVLAIPGYAAISVSEGFS